MPNEVRDIDCLSALKQFWDYLDHELTEERMAEIGKHLTTCQECLLHHDFGRRFLDALQTSRNAGAMPAESRAKVLDHLLESGFSLH